MRELAMPIDHTPPHIAHFERNPYAGVLYLEGDPGIGKTRIVRDVMEASGRLVCTRILSAMGVEDIALAGPTPGDNFINFLANKGFPFVGTEKLWIHPTTGKPPCLFLDEVNRAVPYMMNAFLQGLTERSIHGIPFIPGTVIIAAGNPSDSGVSRFSAAFANRLIKVYTLPPTLDGFTAFCVRNNVNEIIPWYHRQTGGERLFVYNAEAFLTEQAYPTPRIWAECVGPILDNHHLDDTQRIVLVGGAIGFGQSQDFEQQYRLRTQLGDIDAILAGHDQPVPKNTSVRVLAINTLVRRSTHANIGNVFKYISKMAATDPEYADLFEKHLFIKDGTFAGNPAYTKWVLAMNRKPIMNTAASPTAPATPADPVAPAPVAAPTPTTVPTAAPIIHTPSAPSAPTVEDILKSIPPSGSPKRRI